MSDDQLEKEEQRIRDYKETFGTDSGKRVLTELAVVCGFKRPMFTGDVNKAVWLDGARCIYLHIDTMINADIEKLRERYQEQQGSGDTG